MKKLIALFLILSTFNGAWAQRKHIDSLIGKLNNTSNADGRLMLLKQLSDSHNPVTIIVKYGDEGVALSKQLNRPKDEEVFLHQLYNGYFKSGYDYPNEFKVCNAGIKLSRQLNDSTYLAKFLNGVGVSYLDGKQYRKAIGYLLQSRDVSLAIKDNHELSYVYINLGKTYQALKMLDSARTFFTIGYKAPAKYQNDNIGYFLEGLAEIEMAFHHPGRALSYFHQVLYLTQKNGYAHNSFVVDNIWASEDGIAKIYQQSGRLDSALIYAHRAYNTANTRKEYNGIAQTAATLSTLLEKKNAPQSLFYYKIAAAAKDSLNTATQARQFLTLAQKEQQQKEQLKNAATAYQDKLKWYGAIVALLIVIIIVVFLWAANKKQQKTNLFLNRQNIFVEQQRDEINTALADLKATQQQLIQSAKMASLGELTAGIAHEIQNPLNFVNNFSEVSVELLQELKEEAKAGNKEDVMAIADDLNQNLQKINHHGKRADSIVKGMLEHSRASTGTKEATDLNKLADEYLRLAYHGQRAKDTSFNAELVTNFDESSPIVKVIPQDIGRVLLNLFNNAFYAINVKGKLGGDDYKPRIEVSTAIKDGQFQIAMKDNGIGIPDAIKDKIMQPFFSTKPTGEGIGLGLSLSYDIVVKGHGGNIDIASQEGMFTQFTVYLPLNTSR